MPAPRSLVRSGMDLGPWLVEQGITVVPTVPTLASLWPADTLSLVRLLIFGGEGLPGDLAARLLDPEREVWNTYGPGPTVVACAAQMTADGPVRIGLPLDGWDLEVVDGEGHPVADGEVGELIIGGVGLARYLDPAKDAEKYASMPTLGWERAYRSGDLVRRDPLGLLFMGRADDQVKLGGRRIELGEVDAALQALPGVAGGAAAVKTTGAGHAVLIGYLAPHDPESFDIDAAREMLREQLPAALVPRLAIVDDLPTRTSGKVDRLALARPLPGRRRVLDDTDDGRWKTSRPGSRSAGPACSGPASIPAPTPTSSTSAAAVRRGAACRAVRARYPRATVADLYAFPRLSAQATMLSLLEPPGHDDRRGSHAPADPGRCAVQLLISPPCAASPGCAGSSRCSR